MTSRRLAEAPHVIHEIIPREVLTVLDQWATKLVESIFAKFALAEIENCTCPGPAFCALKVIVPLKKCCPGTVVKVKLFGLVEVTTTALVWPSA